MLVYIIGPHAQTPEGTPPPVHVRRAVALGALALQSGFIPIIPHITIGLPALRIPRIRLPDAGSIDADAFAREASYLWYGGGLAGAMSRAGAEVWAILRDDATLSPGTAAEMAQCGNCCATLRTWAGWSEHLRLAGLDPEAASTAHLDRWPDDGPPRDVGVHP